MKVAYKVVVKKIYGYTEEFVFMENNLREAGYIADMFLDKLISPSEVAISIQPYKIDEPEEESEADE